MENESKLPTGWQILFDKDGIKKGYLDQDIGFHEYLPSEVPIMELKKELNLLKTEMNKMKAELQALKEAAVSIDWNFIERRFLGAYRFRTGTAESFEIPDIIPSSANEILVQVNWNTGNEGPSRFVDTKVWTENNDGKKYLIYVSGWRYPQPSLSYDNQTFWFTLKNCKRKIYVESNDVQKENCHNLYINLLGYR